MAKWNNVVITDMGMQLSAQTLSGKKIVYTHAQTTDLDLSGKTPDQLQAMTELTSVKQDIPISSISVNDKETVKIFVKITNEGVKQDYMLYGLAVFAKIDDNPEVLYEVVTAQKPDLVPALTGTTLSGINFSLLTHVAKSENASIIVGAGGLNEDEVLELINDNTIDLSNYATKQQLATKVTDLNNGLSTKVTDNKDGTEQLNGVKVQPFNKLSDTIGGRNLLINTAQLNDSTVCLDRKSNISDTYLGLNIYQTNDAWSGVKIYWSYLAPKIKTNTNYVMSEYVRNTSPTTSATIGIYGNDSGTVFNTSINYSVATLPPNSGWTRISALVNIASFPTTINDKLIFENVTSLTDGYVQFAGLKFEKGSIATDWTPAPEDKVNVSDMRKPASDVAGIDEVNAKQDKIGYTPADDSKVATLQTQVNNSAVGTNLAPGTNSDWQTFSDKGWVSTLTSGKITGLESGNTYTITAEYRNNTVPIHMELYGYDKNNVRIIEDYVKSATASANSSGKLTITFTNTFLDSAYFIIYIAALSQKTTTQSYEYRRVKLEKGSVATDWCPNPEDKVNVSDMRKPASDVAGIEEVNAKQDKLDYTPANAANVVDRNPDTGVVSKPTDFTNLTVNGGKSVATSDDLKSLETSAWRPLKLVSSTSGTILFKDNGDGTASLTGSAIFNVAPDKDNFIAKVDAPDGYVFTSVDWKINIDSSTQIIGINSQYAISETGSNWHALKVKIQDGNLLIGGSNNWNENNLITFNAFTTNLKDVSLAGSPATIGITKSK